MIIVDLETSGVEPIKHSILSIGAIDFEEPDRIFYQECRIFPGAHVDKESLAVCGFKEKEINDPTKPTDGEVVALFLSWLQASKEITLAGHNPSFDRDFLQATAHRYHLLWPLAHRTIDLHSVCYAHIVKTGGSVPLKNKHSALNLDAVATYCGLPKRKGEYHDALEDTKLEAEALARLMLNKNLLSEYKSFPIPWV